MNIKSSPQKWLARPKNRLIYEGVNLDAHSTCFRVSTRPVLRTRRLAQRTSVCDRALRVFIKRVPDALCATSDSVLPLICARHQHNLESARMLLVDDEYPCAELSSAVGLAIVSHPVTN